MARLAKDPWRTKMSMRKLEDEEGGSLEGDEEKVAVLAKRHFCWEEAGRLLEETEVEQGGPGYSIPDLVEKVGKALQGTSNTLALGPDKISYQFIKAVIGTIFGEELLVQMAKELEKGKALSDWQLSKVVMIPKPEKDHKQLKGWRPMNLINCVCKLGEKMVADELQQAGLFHRHQYGSVKGRSAVEPVFREVVRAQRALARGERVAWGIWDVKGGFQNAREEVVINRCQRSEKARRWMGYLKDFF